MPYVRHKLGKTFYIAKGKGNRIPLVFLHGGPGGRHDWNSAILKLGKRRRVFLYDQIGGGRSSPTQEKYWNIETFVSELDTLIKKWKLTRFHLGGSSWGTTLALEYYLRKKGKGIQSLIFSSPMFSANDWKRDATQLISKLPTKIKKVIKGCHELGATDAKVYQEAMMAFYLKHVLRDEKKLKALMELFASGNNTGQKIYEHMWGPSEFEPTGTLKKYNRVEALRKIRVPTLFMCGEFDEATPRTVKKYSKLVKGSDVKILKGCSHASVQEQPALVLKIVDSFLVE